MVKDASAIESMDTPKVFISYSWASPEYQRDVLNIADRLISEAGVEVVVDEYDLEGGQDVVAFMEKLKTDEAISHVIVLSDATYVEKADARKRGVGAEAQILSPSVYEDIGQTRVIAVVMERTAEGNVCLPVFLQSRKYFDFSSASAENTDWERLVRHLWGKPIREKPALGPVPNFLQENQSTEAIRVNSKWIQLKAALQSGMPSIAVLREELLDAFEVEFTDKAQNLLETASESEDEPLVQTWKKMLDLQTGCGEIFFEWMRSEALINPADCVRVCHVPLLQRLLDIPGSVDQSPNSDPVFRDSLKVFSYEMSLYATASLLEVDYSGSLHRLFRHPFVFKEGLHTYVDNGITEFYHHSQMADVWNGKQKESWISPVAQIFSQRVRHPKLTMEKLTQAESLIFVDAVLMDQRCYPSTVIYASRGTVFPWFLKASKMRTPDPLAEVVGEGNWESISRDFATKFQEKLSSSNFPVFRLDGKEWFLRLLAFTE